MEELMAWMLRLLGSTALLAALLIDPAAAQPATPKPVSIAVSSQQLCSGFIFPPTDCTAGNTHTFSADDGAGLTVSGSITALNTAGQLVYQISGTAINTSENTRYFQIGGEQVVAFDVPEISFGRTRLPTTTLAATATQNASALTGVDRSFGMAFPATLSSTLLGTLALDNLLPVYLTTFGGPSPFGSVDTRLDTLAGGDHLEGTLRPAYNLSVGASTSGSFDETLTFQLRYLPERPRR